MYLRTLDSPTEYLSSLFSEVENNENYLCRLSQLANDCLSLIDPESSLTSQNGRKVNQKCSKSQDGQNYSEYAPLQFCCHLKSPADIDHERCTQEKFVADLLHNTFLFGSNFHNKTGC